MKPLILLALLFEFSFTAQAQLLDTSFHPRTADVYSQGSIFFNNGGTDSDNRDLFNLFTSAAGYGLWVNTIRNGSGNAYAFSPTRTEGLTSQSLHALSLFDLYFSYGIHRKEIDASFTKPVTMNFVGMAASADYIRSRPEVKPNLSRQGLQSAFNLVAPVFNNNFRALPADYQSNASFIQEAHNGIRNNILQHWPISEPANGYPQRLIWLTESYLPLMTLGRFDVEPQLPSSSAHPSSTSHFETLLPQIGQLVKKTGPCPKDISLGIFKEKKADGSEVCTAPVEEWYIQPFYQDLKAQNKEIKSPPAVIDEISLGRLAQNHSATLPAIKISTDKDFSRPDEMILTMEFGHVNTDSKSQLAPMVFDNPEEALVARGSLDTKFPAGTKIRIAFHRLALRLKRSFSSPTSWKYAFDNDPTYDKIEVVREKSLKSLTVFVPSGKLTWATTWLASPLIKTDHCKEMPGYCGFTVSNVDQFSKLNPKFLASYFGSKIINKKADDSVDNMIPSSLAQADDAASSAVMSLLSTLKSGVSLLESAQKIQDIKDKLK